MLSESRADSAQDSDDSALPPQRRRRRSAAAAAAEARAPAREVGMQPRYNPVITPLSQALVQSRYNPIIAVITLLVKLALHPRLKFNFSLYKSYVITHFLPSPRTTLYSVTLWHV